MQCRDIVRAEFERRRTANSRYSLRRFAHAMGVHHSTLSRLLRGAGPLPARRVRAFCDRLGLSRAETNRLVALEAEAAVAAAIEAPAFRPDSRSLAMTSGIPVDAVNIALTSLLRARRLRMLSRRHWVTAPETRA